MFGKILNLIILVPIIELLILIEIGKYWGTLNTIYLVIVTGLAGVIFARLEGLRVFNLAQKELQQGRIPADNLIDGVLILVGGIFLIIPGVLTDILGALFIIPFTRAPFKEILKKKFTTTVKRKQTQVEVISIDSGK